MSETNHPEDYDQLSEEQKKRVARANEVYSHACEVQGLQVFSWESFDSWQKYVDGKISEEQLNDQAKQEVERFSSTFGKYLIIKKDDPERTRKQAEEHERAKRANRIYRQVCHEAGLTLCFFRNFDAWSDYVNGTMSDAEFQEKAKAEVREMLAGRD